MPLTPVAVAEAKVAAANMIKATTSSPDYAGIPTAVFTIPELARVGMLEQEAIDHWINLDVRFTDTSGWYSNYRIGETAAAVKILIDRADDRIVGAHLLGPGYDELVNTIGMAIKLGLTTRQLKSATAAYPTIGSDPRLHALRAFSEAHASSVPRAPVQSTSDTRCSRLLKLT